MRISSFSVCCAAALIASPAYALDAKGFYVQASAGGSWAETLNFNVATTPSPTHHGLKATHKSGHNLSLAIGHDFGLIRVEGEYGERANPISSLTATAPAKIPLGYLNGGTTPYQSTGTFSARSGTTISRSAMINAYVQVGKPSATRFYAGGGVGYNRTYAHGYAAKSIYPPIATALEVVRNHDGGVAWQAMAGAREPIGDHVEIGLRYGFYRARDIRMTDTLNRGLRGWLTMQSVQATLGYRF